MDKSRGRSCGRKTWTERAKEDRYRSTEGTGEKSAGFDGQGDSGKVGGEAIDGVQLVAQIGVQVKKKALRYAQGLTEKGCEARELFCKEIESLVEKSMSVIYLDETGFVQDVHRTQAWGLKGEVVYGCQSAQQRPRMNLIGGYVNHKLIAPMLFQGACNTQVFNQWLEHMLLPELAAGSVIVMDNASFHKSQASRDLIEQAACHLLFLPPYSPDLNPIEHVWANLKRERRTSMCSVEELLQTSLYL